MADAIVVLRGRLKSPTGGNLPLGYRVTAAFRQNFAIDPDDATSVVPVPVSRSASTDTDGVFAVELAPANEIQGPVAVTALAPDGSTAGQITVETDALEREVTLDIGELEPFVLTPTDDPTLGRPVRLTGRAMGPAGQKTPVGLPVVIWGIGPDQGADAHPLVVTQTQKDGYFSGSWPPAALTTAFGTVAGGPRIPIPLDPQMRLPRRVILVTPLDVSTSDEDPCSCHASPPRAPDAVDLVSNSATFSTDLGGGRCVNLNTPNRVLEEFSYFKVVRTTQPEVKGVTPTRPPILPPRIVSELVDLVAEPAVDPTVGREAPDRPVPELALEAAVAKRTLGYPENVTSRALANVGLSTEFRQVADVVRAIACPAPGRDANLGVAIDWDDSSLPWQATTVAHGHLLHFKQTWRADGYSMGDLLYSLPLAPCQKKEIAVIDWERQETATRQELLEEEEALTSLLSRDRDVAEIVGSSLEEGQRAGSSTTVWGASGGGGLGFIGSGFGIFAGAAGGGGGASSTAWSDSSRSLSANSLQQIRDQTMQAASAIRDQRATVVQAFGQGESMNVETEVVANHNHCHAITVEYFEVLRHFQLSHELADVQECLFIPLLMTYFDEEKALRWREMLDGQLLDPSLGDGFDCAQRVRNNWLNSDTPQNRYSEEAPEQLEGELRISFILPRPRDNEEAKFVPGNWGPYQPYLWSSAVEWWVAKLERLAIAERDRVFREEAAPRIAENMIQNLRFGYVTTSGGEIEISLDATLVSRYSEGAPLYVSLRPAGGLPSIPREEIARFKIWFDGDLPPDARIMVESGAIRYHTPHLRHFLFQAPRLLNDLVDNDAVVVATPLSREELRSPREEDRQRSRELIAHLNKHLEFFHQIIFRSFHPNHRYMLLDGFEVPDGSGRSLASVVENRLIGIVGNSLVMPVARGHHLDPIFNQDVERPIDLLAHYAPTEPVPAMRVSVPTRGVYAEAIMGDCNACEKKDDTRFWRWQEAPCPDEPTPIQPVSTASRATEAPDVTPTGFPEPVINIQNAPAVPDPTGLSQALGILGRADLFQDITGLEGNQKNALAALQGTMNTAKFFGGKAADFAMQQETSKSIDRTLDNIERARAADLITDEQARAITRSALESMIGQSRPASQAPQDSPAIQKAIDAASQGSKGEITVTTPGESVQASFEDAEPDVAEEGVTGGAFVPQFDNFSSWASIGLSTGGQVNPVSGSPGHTKFEEPAATTARTFLDNLLTTKTQPGMVGQTPAVIVTQMLWGRSVLDHGQFAKVDPSDPTKFQIRIAGRICYPANPKKPNRVAGTTRVPVVAILHGWAPQDLAFDNWSELDRKQEQQPNGSLKVTIRGRATTISQPKPSYHGFEYLQKELAKHGIASISVDNTMLDLVNNFLNARAISFLTTLDEWKKEVDGNAKNPCHGMLDFDNVGFLGHSRGGDAVVTAVKMNKARTSSTSGPRRFGVSAVCSLAPSDFTGSATDDAVTLVNNDMPVSPLLLTYLVVYGSLDGDILGDSLGALGPHGTLAGTGFRLYDRALCRKMMVFAKGACHNRFNTNWGTEPRVITTDPALLNDAKHQTLANFYIAGFFRNRLGGESALHRRFTRDQKPPAGITVALQYSFGQKKVLDSFEGPQNELGVARNMAIGTVTPLKDLAVKPAGAPAPIPQGRHIPHVTGVAHADVTLATTSSRWFTDPLPDPMGANSDWSAFTFLQFRFGQWYDVTTETISGKPAHLRVTLEDFDNNSAVVNESEFFPAEAPGKPFVHKHRELNSPDKLSTLLRMDTVRIPLALFKKRGAKLNKVRAVHFDVDKTDNTHVYIDSLELDR
ncbi:MULTISPECIES: alpha/beta hydrolase [unclassified Mycobacterium]|uniref:alpha/beta hydrolase n=1 Tax=unclassified Mycobacterium TaxID=2642494 RepID=UPI00073FC76D|nr:MULTISPECIES: alpha/beta hydrolase [unclassified Mycobacterium]KUH83210.1 hypothetical protein AU185_05400 [Mycobacterium sp. GA-0227b]KUH84380.1 hypothetical protein AU186_21160 [Mycobacterium sp. GA-1999]